MSRKYPNAPPPDAETCGTCKHWGEIEGVRGVGECGGYKRAKVECVPVDPQPEVSDE